MINSNPTRLRSSSSALIRSRRRVITDCSWIRSFQVVSEDGTAGLADISAGLPVMVIAAGGADPDLGADDIARNVRFPRRAAG